MGEAAHGAVSPAAKPLPRSFLAAGPSWAALQCGPLIYAVVRVGAKVQQSGDKESPRNLPAQSERNQTSDERYCRSASKTQTAPAKAPVACSQLAWTLEDKERASRGVSGSGVYGFRGLGVHLGV